MIDWALFFGSSVGTFDACRTETGDVVNEYRAGVERVERRRTFPLTNQ